MTERKVLFYIVYRAFLDYGSRLLISRDRIAELKSQIEYELLFNTDTFGHSSFYLKRDLQANAEGLGLLLHESPKEMMKVRQF